MQYLQKLNNQTTLWVAAIVASLLNYLFLFGSNQVLTIVEFGIFSTISALLYIPNMAVSAFSLGSLQLLGGIEEKKVGPVLAKLLKIGIVLSILFAIYIVVIGVGSRHTFGLQSNTLLALAGVQVLVLFVPQLVSTALQARLKFAWFALVTVISPLAKIGFGLLFIWWGWQVGGLLLAIALSSVVVGIVSWHMLETKPIDTKSDTAFPFIKVVSASFIVQVGLGFMLTNDLLATNIYLSPAQVGYYAQLQLWHKIIFFAGTSLLPVFLPLVVNGKNHTKQLEVILRSFMRLLGALGVGSAIVAGVFSSQIATLITGMFLVSDIQLLLLVAVNATLLAVLYFYAHFTLITRPWQGAYISAITAVVHIATLWWWHDSISMILLANLVATTFGLVSFSVAIYNHLYGQK